MAAYKEEEGVFPVALQRLVVGEGIETCFPVDARCDFPFKFHFYCRTEAVLEVVSLLDAKLGGVDIDDVPADFHVVGQGCYREVEHLVAFFVLVVVGHTETHVQLSRRQECRGKVVSVGDIVLEQLGLEEQCGRVVPVFHRLETKLAVELEIVLVDAVLAQAVSLGGGDTEPVVKGVVEEPVGVELLVEIAVPLQVGQQVEVVLSALIPVAADVGLCALQAAGEGVEPVVYFHLSSVHRLELLSIDNASRHCQLGGRWVGLYHHLLGWLGEHVLVEAHQVWIFYHHVVSHLIDPAPLSVCFCEPAVVDSETQSVVDPFGGGCRSLLLPVKD